MATAADLDLIGLDIAGTYDPAVDAAYLYFARPGPVASTHSADLLNGGMINLDFDADGHLVGIELLDATDLLPAALLAKMIVQD